VLKKISQAAIASLTYIHLDLGMLACTHNIKSLGLSYFIPVLFYRNCTHVKITSEV